MIIYIQPRSREDLFMITRCQFPGPCDKKTSNSGDEKNGVLEKEVELLKSRVKRRRGHVRVLIRQNTSVSSSSSHSATSVQLLKTTKVLSRQIQFNISSRRYYKKMITFCNMERPLLQRTFLRSTSTVTQFFHAMLFYCEHSLTPQFFFLFGSTLRRFDD